MRDEQKADFKEALTRLVSLIPTMLQREKYSVVDRVCELVERAFGSWTIRDKQTAEALLCEWDPDFAVAKREKIETAQNKDAKNALLLKLGLLELEIAEKQLAAAEPKQRLTPRKKKAPVVRMVPVNQWRSHAK